MRIPRCWATRRAAVAVSLHQPRLDCFLIFAGDGDAASPQGRRRHHGLRVAKEVTPRVVPHSEKELQGKGEAPVGDVLVDFKRKIVIVGFHANKRPDYGKWFISLALLNRVLYLRWVRIFACFVSYQCRV